MPYFKKGKSIRSQARAIVHNVLTFCENEAAHGAQQIKLCHFTKRASASMGVSVSTVSKVKKHYIDLVDDPSCGGVYSKSSKRGRKPEYLRAYLDDLGKCIIRHAISEFYVDENAAPFARQLLEIARERIGYPWKREVFRQMLHSMNYRYFKSGLRKPILVEKPEIVALRTKYLRGMQKYRGEKRVIVYVGEVWVDHDLSFRKCSLSGRNSSEMESSGNSENRLVVAHAGTTEGYIPNAHLVYETGSNSGDFRGQMDYLNFERWVREKVLPNIPPNSVICMDSSPHHSKKADFVPSKYAPKKVMKAWLQEKKIFYDPNMRRPQLFELITQHAPETVVYRVDRIIKEAGHDVIRTPPQHADLNAIEFVFDSVQAFVKGRSESGYLNVPEVQRLLFQSFEENGLQLWQEYCAHVEKIEEKYWTTDGRVEEVIDVIMVTTASQNEETSSDESSGDICSSDSDNDD